MTAILTTSLMPLTFRFLRRLRVLDVATSRSSHEGVALRGTGIALTVGVLAGLVVALFETSDFWYLILAVLILGVASGCLGFIEDVRGLSIRTRLAGQFFLCLLFGAYIALTFGTMWIFVPIVAFLGVAYINMSNFMDGLNGMSGLHGVIAGATFVVIGLATDLSWLVVCGAIFATAFLAFLPWNLGRPGTFLGDSGSYLLGSLHIGLACAAFIAGVPLLSAFGSTAIYVADTMLTLVTRIRNGENFAEPHRDHVYQRLNALGWSHLRVSGTTASFSALVSLASILALTEKAGAQGLSLVLMLAFAIIYCMLPKLISTLKIRTRTNQDGGSVANG